MVIQRGFKQAAPSYADSMTLGLCSYCLHVRSVLPWRFCRLSLHASFAPAATERSYTRCPTAIGAISDPNPSLRRRSDYHHMDVSVEYEYGVKDR